MPRISRKDSQARRKQEESDPVLLIPLTDRCNDRKRRVIHNHTPSRIFCRLIITARPKRTHERSPVKTVFFGHPVSHSVINKLRRVTIIRCQFGLKFFDKFLIIFTFRHDKTFLSSPKVPRRKKVAKNSGALEDCVNGHAPHERCRVIPALELLDGLEPST